MPPTADLPAPVADISHSFSVAVPVPPKFGVGADFNGVDPLGNHEWLYLVAHGRSSCTAPHTENGRL